MGRDRQRPYYQLTTEMVKGQIIRIRLIPIKRAPILYISSRFRQDTIDLVRKSIGLRLNRQKNFNSYFPTKIIQKTSFAWFTLAMCQPGVKRGFCSVGQNISTLFSIFGMIWCEECFKVHSWPRPERYNCTVFRRQNHRFGSIAKWQCINVYLSSQNSLDRKGSRLSGPTITHDVKYMHFSTTQLDDLMAGSNAFHLVGDGI